MDSSLERNKQSGQLRRIQACLQELLNDRLAGILLCGSAVLGGLRPDSDLDILVLIRGELQPEPRRTLTRRLLYLSAPPGHRNARPLEVTVINLNDLAPWRFPPKCEYQYGEWLRGELESGGLPQPYFRADTALLLWQARMHSRILSGKPAAELIPSIPFTEIRRAISRARPELLAWLSGDERNVLLTLARMWYTLETRDICTKDAAAQWAASRVPPELVPLIRMAGEAYLGRSPDHWDDLPAETHRLAEIMESRLAELLETPAPHLQAPEPPS